MNSLHKPAMLEEVLENLSIKENGIYLDCTLGGGGHSRALLNRQPKSRIIAFDQDQDAISYCKKDLFFASRNITFIDDNFSNFPYHLTNLNINLIDGFIFDLGVSSDQLSDSQRGFSYRQNSPLDMRMSQKNNLTAEMIINNYSLKELSDIFFYYGEERKSRKIAEKIFQLREKERITTTEQLVRIAASCQIKKTHKHPARRIFQALRIAVNQELNNLSVALEAAFHYLNKEGRIVVISYHSLEDRIVKKMFCKYNNDGFRILTKKPIRPSAEELSKNHRVRSAKMRVIIRL
jgi:16S rRNA (cytosine1402-N4)-methyltransferase